jgi:hypothetical protein
VSHKTYAKSLGFDAFALSAWSPASHIMGHFLCVQATSYLNKLPAQFQPDDLVLVADPMLATGGTMMQVQLAANTNTLTNVLASISWL